MIDQIKLKCNNTGKNNFNQNKEAIKELVITKAEEQRTARLAAEAQATASEDTAAAAATTDEEPPRVPQKDINLNWFITYILTKRISG